MSKKSRRKANKPHTVLNRGQNFPIIYYCVGQQFAYLFYQEGGYDYNSETAYCADTYGIQKAIEIEKDMQRQDDLMNAGKIPYNPVTFSETQMLAKEKPQPDNTDLFLFESKRAPYAFLSNYYSDDIQNLVDNQESTSSVLIRAHNIDEATKFFEQLKNYKIDYVAEPCAWKTCQRDGYPIKIDNL